VQRLRFGALRGGWGINVLSADNSVMRWMDERDRLRAALAVADGADLVRLLTDRPWPPHALQLIGDGLLMAIMEGVDGVLPVAAQCVDALRARGWVGDEELAEQLDARLGAAPARLLRPLTVDLEELASVLEAAPGEGGGRIDLRTGEVWARPAIDYAVEEGEEDADESEDPDRWLWVHSEGSRAGYRDMQWFIDDVDEPGAADRLSIAIRGSGAFRRFRDVLSRWPDLEERWHGFSDDRQRGRARSWLADEGYAAIPQAPNG
jgi:hypothetical protein